MPRISVQVDPVWDQRIFPYFPGFFGPFGHFFFQGFIYFLLLPLEVTRQNARFGSPFLSYKWIILLSDLNLPQRAIGGGEGQLPLGHPSGCCDL